MLNDSEKSQKLLQAMDDALAMLPLDFESVNETYEKKLQLLTEVYQYVEGSYTIFPAQEVPDQADGLNGYQMSLFDIVSASEPEENTEEPEVEESSAEMEEVQKGEPESESVIVQEQWDENVFEYQGYHFEPVGILPQGLEGKELVNQTRGNTELHLTTYEREDDILYSYASSMRQVVHQKLIFSGVWKLDEIIFQGRTNYLAMRENFYHIYRMSRCRNRNRIISILRTMTLGLVVRKQSLKQIWKLSGC